MTIFIWSQDVTRTPSWSSFTKTRQINILEYCLRDTEDFPWVPRTFAWSCQKYMELNITPQYPWGNIVNWAMGSPLLCLILILPRVSITMTIPRQWYPNPLVAYCFGHLALSHLGVACVLMLRPVYPELFMFQNFELRTSLGTSILLVTFVSDNSSTKHQNDIQLICSCCPDFRGASLLHKNVALHPLRLRCCGIIMFPKYRRWKMFVPKLLW